VNQSAVKTAPSRQTSDGNLMALRSTRDGAVFTADWFTAHALEGRAFGINTGTAIAGNVGNLDRMDYTVIGDMVNTAFRLTSAAERNQILISKETMENIQSDIDVLDVGIVKTKDVQIEAFEVVVPRGGPPGATVQMKSAGSS